MCVCPHIYTHINTHSHTHTHKHTSAMSSCLQAYPRKLFIHCSINNSYRLGMDQMSAYDNPAYGNSISRVAGPVPVYETIPVNIGEGSISDGIKSKNKGF